MWLPPLAIEAVASSTKVNPAGKSAMTEVFKKELLPKPMLFRIPEATSLQFLSTGYDESREDDFYEVYKTLGLTGIEFEFAGVVEWRCFASNMMSKKYDTLDFGRNHQKVFYDSNGVRMFSGLETIYDDWPKPA